MAAIPKVFTSGAFVGRAADVDMHLLTVEAWNGQVMVRLVGAMTGDVQARLDAYEDE